MTLPDLVQQIEMAHGISLTYIADTADPSATQRIQAGHGGVIPGLPAGPVPGLVGGRFRFRDRDTRTVRTVRIVDAASDGLGAQNMVDLTMSEAVATLDGDLCAVIWPV